MSTERIRDPEGIELKHLVNAVQFAGKDVLEVGCGYGWLTWQFAIHAGKVFAIDPSGPDIHDAKAKQPASVTNVNLIQASGKALPFRPAVFEAAFFSSSL